METWLFAVSIFNFLYEVQLLGTPLESPREENGLFSWSAPANVETCSNDNELLPGFADIGGSSIAVVNFVIVETLKSIFGGGRGKLNFGDVDDLFGCFFLSTIVKLERQVFYRIFYEKSKDQTKILTGSFNQFRFWNCYWIGFLETFLLVNAISFIKG